MAGSGRTRWRRDRSCVERGVSEERRRGGQGTHEEEEVGEKDVEEYAPEQPACGTEEASEERDDDPVFVVSIVLLRKTRGRVDAPDELVPFVRDQIHDRPFLADAEEVASQLDAHELEEEEAKRLGGGLAEDARVKVALSTGDDGRKEDVGR